MNYVLILLASFLFGDAPWIFRDKRGEEIALEWCSASVLEAVRPVYLEAYLDGEEAGRAPP